VIGYAGLSHLGIVSSAAAAAKGFDVVAYDPDAALCAAMAAGAPHVVEPGLSELLRQAAPRLTATSDAAALSHCDVVYVSADVPTDKHNSSDLSPVRSLLGNLVDVVQPGAVIVVLSQVQPGFTRSMRTAIETAPGKQLRLFYQVETLVFGRAVDRALAPERFIVGCSDPAEPLPSALSRLLAAFGCPILPMGYESAELCKISINMFLVSSIATTNMLAGICEVIGAEWDEIAPALRLDARIGRHAYLTPGLGVGGGNLTRDLETVHAIALETGADAGLVSAWLDLSVYRCDWALRVLHAEVLAHVPSPKLAVWGIAYKENTGSTKNSPSVALLRTLRDFAVAVYDPEARLDAEDARHVTTARDALGACDGAEVLLVMTPWPAFESIDLDDVSRKMHGRTIIDPFGRLDAGEVRRVGFRYFRLGSSLQRAYGQIAC